MEIIITVYDNEYNQRYLNLQKHMGSIHEGRQLLTFTEHVIIAASCFRCLVCPPPHSAFSAQERYLPAQVIIGLVAPLSSHEDNEIQRQHRESVNSG